MAKLLTQKDRIIEFLQKNGISKNQFYIKTGIANGTLDKKSEITGDTISKIHNSYPEISLEWLIAGEGDMIKSTFSLHHSLSELKAQYVAITHVDPEEISETDIVNIESPAELIPIFSHKQTNQFKGYLSLPNLSSCDGAGYVKGDSMYPLIKPGDIVCYRTANEGEDIHWNKIYIVFLEVDGEKYLTLKYFQKSELGDDYVCLVSYNNKYAQKDILIKEVLWKALVKAYVCYNSIL